MSSKTSSPISQLSQEIIDKIVDHIADISPRDYLDGRANRHIGYYALVSRSFRPRSEFHNFNALYVRDSGETRRTKLQTFMEILQANPRIADYIRELHLECKDFEDAWIGDDPVFLNILRVVCRRCEHQFETDILGPLLDNFFRPFIFPFINTLVLDRLHNVPIAVLEVYVNLQDLKVEYVRFIGTSSSTIPHSTRPIFKSLVLERSRPPVLNDAVSYGWDETLDLTRLQTLIVGLEELPDLQFEQSIVDAAGASLQELRLTTITSGIGRHCDSLVNLQGSPSLHTLHTDIFFPKNKLKSLNRILSTIYTYNSLHTISIKAVVRICDDEEPEILLDADWQTFCIEAIRIMGDRPFTIPFEMVYIFKETPGVVPPSIVLRWEAVLSTLRTEKIARLFSC